MSEKSYTNEQGYTVLKAEFHRGRGTCCKTNCLHCPFGTTVKVLGFDFHELNPENFQRAQDIIQEQTPQDTYSSSLLSEAFGKTKKRFRLTNSNLENFRLISLKEHFCGVIEIENNKIKDHLLLEHFQDQGISIGDIVKCYEQA